MRQSLRAMWHKAVRRHGVGFLALLLVCGCGYPASPTTPATSSAGNATPAQGPKGTLTIAYGREPDNLSPKFGGSAGGTEIRWMFNSPLTYYDVQGNTHPLVARQIPTPDNGDWVINADGTMVTTYRLRENAAWHDGVPLTAHDFAFAYRVYADPDIAVHDREPERLMSAVEALDDRTLVVRWSEPYIYANLLGSGELSPLPRQDLEEKYQSNRASFTSGDEWTSAYTGNGPFRLERWEPGTRIVGQAFEGWFLGPPRIQTLDIRFISDPNTLLANLLAGEVDYASSPAIRASEAVVAREQWASRGDGYLKTWEIRLKFVEFQYGDVPNWQRALGDVRVRRALLYAVDRPALADALTNGLGRVADAWALPSDPTYSEVDRAITKYPFDQQRALSLLAEAGWRSQSGGLLVDTGGQTLDVEVNSGSSEPQIATILGDNWKGAGVNANVFILPLARQNDREFRANFPATHTGERTISMEGFHLISSLIPTPQTGYREPNRAHFSDAEVDRLQNVAVTSFDESARHSATVALNKRMSELAAYGPLYYQVDVLLAKNRLHGPVGQFGSQTGVTWNVFEWELQD
jgi:peptide/nickel transport system substrate-binding protein